MTTESLIQSIINSIKDKSKNYSLNTYNKRSDAVEYAYFTGIIEALLYNLTEDQLLVLKNKLN